MYITYGNILGDSPQNAIFLQNSQNIDGTTTKKNSQGF